MDLPMLSGDCQLEASERELAAKKVTAMDDSLISQSSLRQRTILQETIICYCSVFDLNHEEWISTSENISRLFSHVYQSLGKFPKPTLKVMSCTLGERWHLWFAEIVIKQSSTAQSQCDVMGTAVTYALNFFD